MIRSAVLFVFIMVATLIAETGSQDDQPASLHAHHENETVPEKPTSQSPELPVQDSRFVAIHSRNL